MAITQTARNGIPLLDGLFHPLVPLFVPYEIRMEGGVRTLVSKQGKYYLPNKQRYYYYYNDELHYQSGNLEMALRFGYLRHLSCGAVMAFNTKDEQLAWIGSFSYAAAFEEGSLHGSRLLLRTADSELWQFDFTNPRSIKVSILPQLDRITRIK